MTAESTKRDIADFRKGIRKKQPKVRKSIDNLVDSFLKSADYTAFQKRFKRQ